MRLVMDTNVLVSAFLWEGRPRQLLSLGNGKEVAFFTSASILTELNDVLSRRKFANVVIGTALAAKADCIVTGDHALLAVAEYEGARIISVIEALRVLTAS